MCCKIPVNGNKDQDETANQEVAGYFEGNQQGSDQQLGEISEETFMNNVHNIGEQTI